MNAADGGAGHDHWFEPIAEHLGSAYLRYSFTKGTRQEVDHLESALGLVAGASVLDVGCGPGRHAHELARRGMTVLGIDISQRFVDLAVAGAPDGATFERLDARSLGDRADLHGRFDAVVCLCQGAFGLMTAGGDDDRVLAGMAAALRPGGWLALSAFNAYFAVRHFDGAEGSDGTSVAFDADSGVNHERTEVRDESGRPLSVDLWTGCYTPRELRLLCASVGLEVTSISSVEPGAYADRPPTTESPEFLVVARRR
ncbi:MAG: class I SAM-dependent methyltransferase [Ilumatobacteraceae bacterium]